MNKARTSIIAEQPDYVIIGLGSCGTVFEVPGTAFAIKKGPDVAAMWKDFMFTNIVHNAIADCRRFLQDIFPERTLPRTPECTEFLMPGSEKWEVILDRFPRSHRKAGAAFYVDRILPLSQAVREALIKKYFDDSKDIQEEAKNNADNKHCLIRVYMGENEEEEAEFYDSLRNFPMRLNMIEELDLDTTVLAVEMAMALAVVHWEAKIDAMDSEFVLGSAAATASERRAYTAGKTANLLPAPHEVHRHGFTKRTTHLWLLDFDKANPIELTADDVYGKLVPAFLGNDPYYPRPNVNKFLWEEFSCAYLKASEAILKRKQEKEFVLSLPKLFLDRVVETVKKQEEWDPEQHIVFG